VRGKRPGKEVGAAGMRSPTALLRRKGLSWGLARARTSVPTPIRPPLNLSFRSSSGPAEMFPGARPGVELR
jgi:hypothetical protein